MLKTPRAVLIKQSLMTQCCMLILHRATGKVSTKKLSGSGTLANLTFCFSLHLPLFLLASPWTNENTEGSRRPSPPD